MHALIQPPALMGNRVVLAKRCGKVVPTAESFAIRGQHGQHLHHQCSQLRTEFQLNSIRNFGVSFPSRPKRVLFFRDTSQSDILPSDEFAPVPPIAGCEMAGSATFEKVCFSDIDGTLVHYPHHGNGQAEGGELLRLPPSTTGLQGVISKQTIHSVAELRRAGIGFALVSGARTSTVLQRLPFLPAADAYVTENGGRIFYPHSDLPTAAPLTEDLEWRSVLEDVTGPAHQESLLPEERKGLLWEWYRTLKEAGWQLDAAGYATCFRVKSGGGKSADELRSVIASAPKGLTCTFNLGVADFYPAASGKAGSARYLMQRWGSSSHQCAFLCDDDNDLELAAVVGRAFLPSITSDSVKDAVKATPDQFVLATKEGTAASEEMVEAVRQHLLAL